MLMRCTVILGPLIVLTSYTQAVPSSLRSSPDPTTDTSDFATKAVRLDHVLYEDSTSSNAIGHDRNTIQARASGLSGDEWQKAVHGGRTLWQQLQSALVDPLARDPPDCDICKNWQITPDDKNPLSLKLPWDGLFPMYSSSKLWYGVKITAQPGAWSDGLHYGNMYSPSLGAIMAYSISGKFVSGTIVGSLAPDRWSDVTWAYWKSICASQQVEPSSLTWTLQDFITNDRTRSIINTISARREIRRPTANPKVFDIVLDPSMEEFFAMMKAPNVVGTVWMLKTYVHALRKTIKQVTVRTESPCPNLLVELTDYVEAEDTSLTAKGGTIDTH